MYTIYIYNIYIKTTSCRMSVAPWKCFQCFEYALIVLNIHTFTLHLHYIYITFTLHLHYIYITFTGHLQDIYRTFTYWRSVQSFFRTPFFLFCPSASVSDWILVEDFILFSFSAILSFHSQKLRLSLILKLTYTLNLICTLNKNIVKKWRPPI